MNSNFLRTARQWLTSLFTKGNDSHNYRVGGFQNLNDSPWLLNDYGIRDSIPLIRNMHDTDGLVSELHNRTARLCAKGGILLKINGAHRDDLSQQFKEFIHNNGLDNREKLESDARGLLMEGSLALETLVKNGRVVGLLRLPVDTFTPITGKNGRIKDDKKAYCQRNETEGELIYWPKWAIRWVRANPINFDDQSSLGIPYFHPSRKQWKKLTSTENDMFIRRKNRSPLRWLHHLPGFDKTELKHYRMEDEQRRLDPERDFYMNQGEVKAIQGDANLGEIDDVFYSLERVFAGLSAPLSLFGFSDRISRDILEDLKRDYFDYIDTLQDTISRAYHEAFLLDCLLSGINVKPTDFIVMYKERKTMTDNQLCDLALKKQALGVSQQTIFETINLDYQVELERKKAESQNGDPYANDFDPTNSNQVSITPGNAKKGESATTISTQSN